MFEYKELNDSATFNLSINIAFISLKKIHEKKDNMIL